MTNLNHHNHNESSIRSEVSAVSVASSVAPHWTDNFTFLKQHTHITRRDVFHLTMTIVIGGQYTVWKGTNGGFGVSLFSLLFNAVGFACVCLCLSEMVSTLPFSGGVYGFVRAFIPYPIFGFMVACFEIIYNLFAVAFSVYFLAEFPYTQGFYSHDMVIVNCLIIHLIILAISLLGGRVFGVCLTLFGVASLWLIIIFIFGSIPNVDFDRWATNAPSPFFGPNVMQHISMFAQAFFGIQYLPLASKLCKDPKNDIPFVLNMSMVLITVTSVLLLFMLCSQFPGTAGVALNDFPLSDGFMKMFNISKNAANWLSIPGTFAYCFGFIYCYGYQAFSMAKSGLLPSIFLWQIPFLDTPYMALLCGAGFSFFLCVAMWADNGFGAGFRNISALAGYLVFVAAFISYIQFKRKYSSLQRSFTSPLGVFGAVLGLFIFLILIIALIGFEDGGDIAVAVALGVTIIMTVVFVLFIANHQVFSDEEKDELFKAYLINGKALFLLIHFCYCFSDVFAFSISANVATKNRMKKRGRNSSVVPHGNATTKPHTSVSRPNSSGVSGAKLNSSSKTRHCYCCLFTLYPRSF